MGSKIEYVDSAHIYATSYVRNSKAIGVLWAIFTICYAIIGVVSFIAPDWLGDSHRNQTVESDSQTHILYPGKMGLWSVCWLEDGVQEQCRGRLDQWNTSNSVGGLAFQGATLFIGLAVFGALLTVVTMLLFFCLHSTTVFHICGWLQTISAIFMIAGCVCYPAGWSEDGVRRICGPEANIYYPGNCTLRWAYLLAGIGCLDAIILAILAFILATRHVRLQPDPNYAPSNSLYKGEMNGGYVGDGVSLSGSRKSLNLHPVLMMHPGHQDTDTYSQFSQRTVPRSQSGGAHSVAHSLYYPSRAAHPSHYNFQL